MTIAQASDDVAEIVFATQLVRVGKCLYLSSTGPEVTCQYYRLQLKLNSI